LRIKICGITSAADARLAADAGVDAIGINFFPRSPRFISEELGLSIAQALPERIEVMGLVVNESAEQVQARLRRLSFLHAIQWHGEQPPTPPVANFVPAFQVKNADDLARATDYLRRCEQAGQLPSAILVDGQVAGRYGGTGQAAPWELLAGFRPGVPLFLAGGLNPDNVADAIRIVRPDAVDVASGVESAPGKKDADLVRRFIAAARSAAP